MFVLMEGTFGGGLVAVAKVENGRAAIVLQCRDEELAERVAALLNRHGMVDQPLAELEVE